MKAALSYFSLLGLLAVFSSPPWPSENYFRRKDDIVWQVYSGVTERCSVMGSSYAAPTFYRSERSECVRFKNWVIDNCGSFANYTLATNGSYALYFSNNPSASAIPAWTLTGIIARLNIPTNYFTQTPWHQLNGGGQAFTSSFCQAGFSDLDYGWKYADEVLSALRWYIPLSTKWYAERNFTGPPPPQYCTDSDTFDGVCANSNACFEASSTTTNDIIIGGDRSADGVVTYVYGYLETLDELICTNDAFVSSASAYLLAKSRWRGRVASALNTTNYSAVSDSYIKRLGLICSDAYSDYVSAGGSVIPGAWSNENVNFVLFDNSGADFVQHSETNYVVSGIFYDEHNNIMNTVCPSSGFYAGPSVQYGCGFGGHCSLLGNSNTYYLGDSYWYEVVTISPEVISVLKYDVAGGFNYITTNAP